MTFSTKLGNLQPIIAVFIILIIFLGFGLLLFFITRRFTDHEMRRSHNDIVGYIFTTIGAIYGVLLAFLTVIVWQNYNDAATNAAKEATAALAVYRDLDCDLNGWSWSLTLNSPALCDLF
jgi:heme/copper-type cytochrome/quinol oxidase subunit 2